MPSDSTAVSLDPGIDIPDQKRPIKKGVALCLSGGGYRAMMFHVGTLLRLLELGFLNTDEVNASADLGAMERISSVSGGSITAAVLAKNWARIAPGTEGERERFDEYLTKPIMRLASKTIDVNSVLIGLLPAATINKRIIKAYKKYLGLGHDTLDVFPDEPRFVINATNLQSGALWRFMKQYSADWKVGKIPSSRRKIDLAAAVAASSAFPPVLSPAIFKFKESDYLQSTGGVGENNLQRPPFTTRPILSDGGVYDNLGMETCWKHFETILVSDAGGKLLGEEKVGSNWASQSYRVLNVIDNQVRSLRKRQLIASYARYQGTCTDGGRRGAYWGIRTNISNFELDDALDCPLEKTIKLAEIATRLKKMDLTTQHQLINWGYAVCDAGIRKHVISDAAAPAQFPYPDAGVG
jgi:NTE family protein